MHDPCYSPHLVFNVQRSREQQTEPREACRYLKTIISMERACFLLHDSSSFLDSLELWMTWLRLLQSWSTRKIWPHAALPGQSPAM